MDSNSGKPKLGNFVDRVTNYWYFRFYIHLPREGEKDMGKNTSISIGQHFDSFVQSQVSAGRYASTSEVVRAGLRLLEQEEEKLNVLRRALIDGEQSGFVEQFDPQAFRARLKQGQAV